MEVAAIAPIWDSQFEGFLGADDGTIDNCRFEKTPDSINDWKIEKYSSYSRTSTYKHDNTYSLMVSNTNGQDVVITQTIDTFNLQQIKDLAGGSVCFSFWFRAATDSDNENARAILVFDGVEYAGDWTPASDRSGALKWTHVWVKASVPSGCQVMKVKIIAIDPDDFQTTTVYLDDARLAIYDYKTKTANKGKLRLDLMYETCKDYWAESGWNELQYSIAFSVQGLDPDHWKIARASIIMELHPLAIVWYIPIIYAAQCDAELQVARKGFVGQTSTGITPVPQGTVSQDSVPFDLDIKAISIGLKYLTAKALKAAGYTSTLGGVLIGTAVTELLSYYLNSFNDDTFGQGWEWGDYFTKTLWEFAYGTFPEHNMPITASFQNRVSFRWDRTFTWDHEPEVRIYGYVDWYQVGSGSIVTESIGPYFISTSHT